MHKQLNCLLICLLIFATVISASLTGVPVYGADETDPAIGDVTDPGILPDSGFYFMKSWGRNFQLMFAAGNAEKAQLHLKYANEDALALKRLCEMGKCDVAARHTEQYTTQFQNTVRAMEQLRAQQGDSNAEALSAKLEQNYLRQQAVLASVLKNTPESAQTGILNAIENSNKHMEAYILANKGQAALEQYQEQVLQQTANMGETTRLKVQQRLQASHGQANQNQDSSGQQSGATQTQTQTQTQTHTQTQMQLQTQTLTQPQQQMGQGAGGQGNQGNGNSGKK